MHTVWSSVFIGTAPLVIVALIALGIAARRTPASDPTAIRSTRAFAWITLVLQCSHAAEEGWTGFYFRYPTLLGLAPWPLGFFVTFNGCWIALWAVVILTFPGYPRLTSPALWFLGIAAVVNGVVHPLLALLSGGYFPGVLTAPFLGLGGVALLKSLSGTTVKSPG